LCESKLPVNNIILSELLEIKRNIHEIKSMAVPFIDKMSTKNEWDKKHISPMSLSNIISVLLSFPKELNVSNEASVKVLYSLLFNTQGDLQNEEDKEYNEIRDAFMKIFGVHVARSLSYYFVYKNQIDWLKGVNEDHIKKTISDNFIMMFCLLSHKEIDIYSDEISTFIDNSLNFCFRMESEIDISHFTDDKV